MIVTEECESLGVLLETSVSGLGMAVWDLKRRAILTESTETKLIGSSAMIASCLESLLRSIGRSKQELAWGSVSCGPGSFTGIKVGISFMRGLARGFGERFEIVGLSSLLACAQSWAQSSEESVAVYLPATTTRGYVARVGAGNSCSLLESVDLSNLTKPEGRTITVGEWPQLEKLLVGSRLTRVDVDEFVKQSLLVQGTSLSEFVLHSANGDRAGKVEPIYLRPSSPEERLLERYGSV